jgi:hypothetical protein
MQNMHIPHTGTKKIVKYEKICYNMFIEPSLPAAGRPGVAEQKICIILSNM